MFKYIIFESVSQLTKVIIFDCITEHSSIKNKFIDLYSNWTLISAGKINKDWNCTSGSISLDIKWSREQSEEDTKTINKMSEYY